MSTNSSLSDDILDSWVCEYFRILSRIISMNHHLEDCLTLGRLLLAKSRHNVSGNGSRISSTAYNHNEMSTRGATLRVKVDSTHDQKGSENDGLDLVTSHPQFHLNDQLLVNGVHVEPTADPIRWFGGVLIPTSLRRAQASFRRALHMSIELANERAKLQSLSFRLRTEIGARIIQPLLPLPANNESSLQEGETSRTS